MIYLNKKGDIEIDQLLIWLLAAIILIVLITVIINYRESLLKGLSNFFNILRFGGS